MNYFKLCYLSFNLYGNLSLFLQLNKIYILEKKIINLEKENIKFKEEYIKYIYMRDAYTERLFEERRECMMDIS